jgi:membrane-associated phospholipid phosphatase
MMTVGIKLRITFFWGCAALAAAGPASPQTAPLHFDARLLPAHVGLAAPSAAAPSLAPRFDARLLPAGSMLSAATALGPAPAARYDVRPLPAGAILAGTIALALVPSVYASHFPTATCAPCDPAGLWGIDRGTVGPVRPGAATASDVFLFAALGGAGLLVFAEDRGGRGSAAEDLTVFAQAVATADALTSWAKVLFHRPRPFRYVPAETTITVQSGLSFPSGHSTAAFAAAFAYWSIQARHGRANEKAPQIALLLATAATTGMLRVVARQHFPTDVMAGAAIGATIGWFVPRLYPVRR